MQVNIQIEQDAQLRAAIREIITNEVRGVMRKELAGIVHGELARLKLQTLGSNKQLSDIVQKFVDNQIKEIVSAHARAEILKASTVIAANLQRDMWKKLSEIADIRKDRL